MRKSISFGAVKPSATIPFAGFNCQGADEPRQEQMIWPSPEFPLSSDDIFAQSPH